MNGAVGIIGTASDDANLMYGGVLTVGVIGALIARFRPHGMARALSSGESIVTEAFTAEPGRWDAGDRTDGTTFPVDWRIQSTAGSSPVDIRFETTTGGRPVQVLGIPFWVGRCRVSATTGSENLQGSGYVLIRGEERPEG